MCCSPPRAFVQLDGARLTLDGGKVTVKDGPFAEAKELIAGFAIIDVKSKDEAIEHAKRFANIVGAPQVDVPSSQSSDAANRRVRHDARS